MSTRLVAMIASCVLLTGCAQDTDRPAVAGNPVGPTAVTGSGPAATSTPSASNAFVPFHSELTCERYIPGSDISLCPRPAPAGTIYLACAPAKRTAPPDRLLTARLPRFHT